MAIRPDRASSKMPKGFISSIKASILFSFPESSITRESGLDYLNVKADYVKAFWDIVNWENVAERFDKARA